MSKKSNVRDITTGEPLKPVPDHIWLIVLFQAHPEQADILANATTFVPDEYWNGWGLEAMDARVKHTYDTAQRLLEDLAKERIAISLDGCPHEGDDESRKQWKAQAASDAIDEEVFEMMPGAQSWAEGMTGEEVGVLISAMLYAKMVGTLDV
jgi:hypothetical protein